MFLQVRKWHDIHMMQAKCGVNLGQVLGFPSTCLFQLIPRVKP